MLGWACALAALAGGAACTTTGPAGTSVGEGDRQQQLDRALGAPPGPSGTGQAGSGPSGPAPEGGEQPPIVIRWNEWGVPFIEAQRDQDVPYGFGVVHAHLRLGQMELIRMLAHGRASEMVGPLGIDVDVAIRAIGFARASEATVAAMRPDTRAWLERYAQGINAYKRSQQVRPLEQRLLNIPDEPWTAQDVVTVGRVAAIDINWIALGTYLRNRQEPGFAALWQRMVEYGRAGTPSFGAPSPAPLAMLANVSKSGSNSWVVGGARRAGPGTPALIASDPHVGFVLPSLWLIAGARSPGYAAVGFMIPGLPVVMLGRNDRIAWGGTNMVGLSTSAYDVTDLPAQAFTERTELIRVRLLPDVTRTIRTTALGTVVTDSPFLATHDKRVVALKWRGNQPSDEFSALLDVNRAQNFEQFRAAFAPYAVSGQNFLYADVEGNIGQVLAIEAQPAAGRTAPLPLGDPANPQHLWGAPVPSTALPFAFNPGEGYLISANNPPVHTEPRVTLLTSADDRVGRLRELIEDDSQHSVDSHRRHQLDVYSRASHALAQEVVRQAKALPQPLRGEGARVVEALRDWDGQYDVDSTQAPLAHRLQHFLGQAFYEKKYGPKSASFLMGSVSLPDFLRQDLASGEALPYLAGALRRTGNDTPAGTTWGEIHRLRVAHALGNIPVLGGAYRYEEFGVPGNLTTVMKSATNAGRGVQRANYGANARHISDLADPDENHFVMMGGQDGWIGAPHFADMVPLWREGRLIRVPLSPQGVRQAFTRVTVLQPQAPVPSLRAAGEAPSR